MTKALMCVKASRLLLDLLMAHALCQTLSAVAVSEVTPVEASRAQVALVRPIREGWLEI